MNKLIKIILNTILLSIILIIILNLSIFLISKIMGIIIPSTEVNYILILLIEFFKNLIYILLLYYIAVKSDWNGLKLSILFFLCLFGISNFLNNIEGIFFHALNMSLKESILFLISGLITYLFFSPLFVFIIGKWKQDQVVENKINIKTFITIKNIFKILLLSVFIYPLIYFSFGFFFSWKFVVIKNFYSSSNMPDLLPLYTLQIFRGLTWIVICFPILISLKITKIKKSIILGLIFGIFMAFELFYPNPYMPLVIRMIHFPELMISNFIWGFLVVLFLDNKEKKKTVNNN